MTIRDIARETGFSVSTVSRALNNHPDVSIETIRKVQEVVKAHNFIPNSNARHLKITSTNIVAVLVKGISNMLFLPIVEEIQRHIKQAGFTVAIHYLDEDDNAVTNALRLCRELKPAGLVFLGANLEEFKNAKLTAGVPGVVVTDSAKELNIGNLSSVTTDDAQAASAAMEYLIRHGHKNIAIVGGDRLKSSPSKARYTGCIETLKSCGIEFNESIQYETARYSFKSAYRAAKALLSRMPDMTGVLTMSDTMAFGVIRALNDSGIKVPEDISVIGFDGIELADFYIPRLTTIRQSWEKIALRSVEILISCIKTGDTAKHEVIPFEMIEGGSVRQLE